VQPLIVKAVASVGFEREHVLDDVTSESEEEYLLSTELTEIPMLCEEPSRTAELNSSLMEAYAYMPIVCTESTTIDPEVCELPR